MRQQEKRFSRQGWVMDYGSAMGWSRQKTSIGAKIKGVDRGKYK
jgi:hypothetical protein